MNFKRIIQGLLGQLFKSIEMKIFVDPFGPFKGPKGPIFGPKWAIYCPFALRSRKYQERVRQSRCY